MQKHAHIRGVSQGIALLHRNVSCIRASFVFRRIVMFNNMIRKGQTQTLDSKLEEQYCLNFIVRCSIKIIFLPNKKCTKIC